MTYIWGGMVGLAAGQVVGLVVWLVRSRRRYPGARMLPGWVLTADHLGEDARIIVAKVARASVRDMLAEWDTVPPGLRAAIRTEIVDLLTDRERTP